MKNKRSGFTIVPIVLLLALYFIFFFPPDKNPPTGIPNNYFDIIEDIEEESANVYVYSDTLDFNEDYTPIFITSIQQVQGGSTSPHNFLIIDMEKYDTNEFGTLEQINYLYRERFFHILIVNNKKSNSTFLDDLIDYQDRDSDLITLTFTPLRDVFYSGSNSGEIPNNQILMYSILFAINQVIVEYDSY